MKSSTLVAAALFTALAGSAYAQDNQAATTNGTDHNPAVATTAASTATPAKGSNSFTMKQAQHRIARHGFTQVKDLTKDDNGVWHGTAMQNGAPVKVWEDYKGSVGTE